MPRHPRRRRHRRGAGLQALAAPVRAARPARLMGRGSHLRPHVGGGAELICIGVRQCVPHGLHGSWVEGVTYGLT